MEKLYKKSIFYSGLILLFLFCNVGYSQKFAGISNGGGASSGGMVFRINADGSQFTDLKDMPYYAQYPQISLASNGTVIFGITGSGGTQGMGTLFSMNVDGSNFQTLHVFNSTTGDPSTAVIQASDNNLYGTAKSPNLPATIYKVSPTGTGFTVIYTFPLNFGDLGNLFEANDGKLYGLTTNGGTNHYGSIFSVNKDGSGYTDVYFFPSSDGATNYAALIQDANGNFYGVGPGGANGKGQIFKLPPGAANLSDLFDFDSNSGQDPRGGLLLASDGNLYGGTSSGGANGTGTLYSVATNGTGFHKIYDLNRTDGDFWGQKLIEDPNGFLYGTTIEGGTYHAGSIFKIKTDGTLYQKIYDFENPTSFGGFSAPIVIGNNKIIGVNNYGATYGVGNVFSIQTDGSGYTDLYDFGGKEGYQSYGPLIQGIDSLLYGTTYAGGVSNAGTIFVTNANGQGYTKLFDFGGSNGINPPSGLTQSVNGTLFGSAYSGGVNGVGTIFALQPNGTSFTKLHDFSNTIAGDGAWPRACPMVGADGNLYGSTSQGGSSGYGTIYSCKPDGSNFTILVNFTQTNGAFPYSSLVQEANGTLYGVTTSGGTYNNGVIFSIQTDGSLFTILHQFNLQNNDGATPYSPLILGQDGNLYGLTSYGGTSNSGTFFSIQTDGSNYKKLYEFVGNVYALAGSPVQLSNGLFYGIGSSGGVNGGGQMFSVKADGTAYTDVYDFPSGTSFYYLNSLTPLKLRKQSINFSPIAETSVGGAAITLSATASSSLPVSFSSGTPTLAQVKGAQVTTLAPGKATIFATQPGDGIYDLASAQRSFCIDPDAPTISISAGNNTATPTLTSSASSGNQWFLNGSAITGATGTILSVNAVGAYTVQTTTTDGCTSAVSANFPIIVTGDLSMAQTISLYPNPSQDFIFINGISEELTGSSVIDMIGRPSSIKLVQQGDVVSGDIRNLAAGIYILKITAGASVALIKFIKQ